MLIFNINQADFLFKFGVKILHITKGKNGDMGILFDKFDSKFNYAMEAWIKVKNK